jgi:hypothetical protein
METLKEKAMALATKVYQEAANRQQEESSKTSESSDDTKKDDAINADFEEKE